MPSDKPVVLIVDDDPDERALLTEALERDSFTVVDAATGREAQRILDTDPTVRVLIADILMPGISGVTLAEKATESRADVPVILISEIDSAAPPKNSRYWFKKPVALDELRALVASLCGVSSQP